MGTIPFSKEQMQAAYALNLCTVSVSQIIAYNDREILEQEYETILNNLNLENMPKDEALLEILKRLLETITFFRLQEGEKEFIEKEYQQKMKNAIWTAVPNLALLVAGANPVSMGISLASQVGIGYMNYRKNRAQYHLDRDEQLWKLQRSAMEQFEGLQQQLFEASWRLADKYQFPDALRLTERQIRQYNDILMDQDPVRKYERMDSVKQHFAAYPPFWYYFGNTANTIANDPELSLPGQMRDSFLEKAKQYFAYFQGLTDGFLLREDEICASCCLEYADLLDPVTDSEKILHLIDKAVGCAGNSFDVHQLCAISYMKAGCMDKAARELKLLVNENYNGVVNAQLLSTIYVERCLSGRDPEAELSYRLLSGRIRKEFLFPMPEVKEIPARELQEDFIRKQQKVLEKMYQLVMNRFVEKYEAMVCGIIPLPSQESMVFSGDPDEGAPEPHLPAENRTNALFQDSASARAERIRQVKMALSNKNLEAVYRQEVQEVSFSYRLIGILNQMFSGVCLLECVQDEHTRLELQDAIMDALHDNRESVQEIEASLEHFDVAVYERIQEITLRSLLKDFFEKLGSTIKESVEAKREMQDFAIAETSLARFCGKEGIPLPELLYTQRDEAQEGSREETYFTPDLLSEQAVRHSDRAKKNGEMIRLVKEYRDQVVLDPETVEFYTQEDPRMNRYFYNKALQKYSSMRSKALAVLDDRSRGDCDLLFTTEGIMAIIRGHAKNAVGYQEIDWTGNARKKELRIGVKYENSNLNMDALYELFQKLAEYAHD